MGCISSTGGASEKSPQANGVGIDERRKRLSVGQLDEHPAFSNDENPSKGTTEEDDRGLIASLSMEKVIDILGANNGNRRFSIGSETDQGKTAFVNKSMQKDGDPIEPMGLGYTCRKGLKPEGPNQDSWSILQVDGRFSIYGVYDGHGQKGHDVSNFVKENLPKLVLKDPRFQAADTDKVYQMMKDTFKKIQNLLITADRLKTLSAQMSGTTATVVIHDHAENKITVSHVADSTCVLGKQIDKGGTPTYQAVQLTRDHKPDLKDERARIEEAGGRVVFDGYANHRVYAKNGAYPGLNMSRCLGDLLGHADAGCSCEPEVQEIMLQPEDHVLLLCSDGVWEFVTPQEAVDIVCEFGPAKATEAADRLAKESWDRWIREEAGTVVDDITVCLIYLNQDLISI